MSNKFRLAAASLAATCFLTSMAGCAAANRTQYGTTPSGTITRQGMNLSQRITRGTTPNLLMQGTNYGTSPSGMGYGTSPSGMGYGTTPSKMGYGTTPSGMSLTTTTFDTQRAKRIVSDCKNVKGVKNVTAIVNGNIALISYTPSHTSANMKATKDAITKKVKAADSRVKNVVVSESPDIVSRMQRLSTDITSKRTATDLNNTFNQLVKMAKGPY